MKTIITTLGIALLTTATVTAQEGTTPARTAPTGQHACIMADTGVWTDLGLDQDQVTKVKDVQAACQKEHDAAKAAGTKYMGASKHEEELKAILTPEQYTKWTQWCDAKEAKKTELD
jgi:hypothetical protein